MRLAMQMSLQESQPAPRQPALSYPQGVSGGDDDDPALRAALAASMAEAPRVHEAGGETRMRPAAVGWVAGAPPPPQVDTEATLLHRPRAPDPPAPPAAPPSVAPNPAHSALDAQLQSTLAPITAPTFQPRHPQWAGQQTAAAQPQLPPGQTSQAGAGRLASLEETATSDWANPSQAPPKAPMAPPLSRQSSLDHHSPSSRDRILEDRAARQPAYMALGANLASLQAGQAATLAEQPARLPDPVSQHPPSMPHAAYPGMASTSPTHQGTPAPAPAAPASLWQAQPAGAGGGEATLESDFERTIRLIEEANQKRGS